LLTSLNVHSRHRDEAPSPEDARCLPSQALDYPGLNLVTPTETHFASFPVRKELELEPSMADSFGTRLRERREAQDIALATIAEKTKIKQSLLEALERDDISHWPTGIFRRAFIRAYALAIGFDPDVIVREFFEVFPEPVEVVTTSGLSAAADAARGATSPPTRLRSLFGAFLRRSAPADEMHEEAVSAEPPDAAPVTLPKTLGDDGGHRAVPECSEPDFSAIAQVCTEFARVDNPADVRPLLRQAALVLNATGVVVWVWDAVASELRPTLAAGYADSVLAHLPNVRPDADNVTAHAYRSGQACSIDGVERSALVVPLLTPSGCAGVLAFELHGNTLTKSVRAAATIVAAQLSQLIGGAPPSEVPVPALADSDARLAC
jgi:transcriptional regulator with XRE-family HTH domain